MTRKAGWRVLLAGVAALVLLPAVGHAWVPDAWVATRAKIALFTTPEVDALTIDVDSIDGAIILHGTAPSGAARKRAETAVRAIPEVREVRNLLQVVPPSRVEAVEIEDDHLREAVERRLRSRPSIRDGGIEVRSVHKGVVLLGGSVRDAADHLLAIRLVRGVSGVRAVSTQVAVEEPATGLGLLEGHELRNDGRDAIDVARDLWITAETKLRLLADPVIPALDVNVDTRDRVVTLFGVMSSDAERAACEEAVARVPGVRRVRNELQVVARDDRRRVERRDDEIREEVSRRMREREELRGAVVRVEVAKGAVRLTGTVPTAHHRLLAATLARRVPGVRSVAQELRVRSAVTMDG